MTTAYTKGPWKTFSNRNMRTQGMSLVTHIFSAEGGSALFTHYYQINDNEEPYENFEEVDSNFRLAAAAPEMLEALSYWIPFIQGQEGKSNESDIMVDKAIAVIAKATGNI